jgi:AraC family transcriptional regulator, transcriptional activator of pobA
MIEIKRFDQADDLLEVRRIRKYVLVWCSSGKATIVVDENEFELKANSVITITQDKFIISKNLNPPKVLYLNSPMTFFARTTKTLN